MIFGDPFQTGLFRVYVKTAHHKESQRRMTAWNKVPIFLESTPPGFLWQHPAQLHIVKKSPNQTTAPLSALLPHVILGDWA